MPIYFVALDEKKKNDGFCCYMAPLHVDVINSLARLLSTIYGTSSSTIIIIIIIFINVALISQYGKSEIFGVFFASSVRDGPAALSTMCISKIAVVASA